MRAAGPTGCTICGKPAQPRYRPFCSRRCADVDLARWLRGDYSLPGRDGDATDEVLRRYEAGADDMTGIRRDDDKGQGR